MSQDIYQSLDEFNQYHLDNDDQNSQITAGLAQHCQDEEIKNAILHYSTQKDSPTIRKELNKVDINTLKKTANYLGLPSDYKTANVITTKIVIKLTALMRCICGSCSGYYNAGDEASLFCSKCTRPCHDKCYKDSQEGLKPGISLLFTCYQCTKKTQPEHGENVQADHVVNAQTEQVEDAQVEPVENTDTDKHKQSDQPNHPVLRVIDAYNLDILYGANPQANYPVCELYKRGECPHGQEGLDEVEGEICKNLHPKVLAPNYHDDAHSTKAPETRKEDKPLCRYFKNSRCKYGVSGKDCNFKHEPACGKFIRNGNKGRYGCRKGSNCTLFHPKMCWDSMNLRICNREYCKFMHIKGTIKSSQSFPPPQNTFSPPQPVDVWNNRDQQANQPHPHSHHQQPNHPQPTNDQSQNHQSEPFLEMMKEMNKQLSIIRNQQQQLFQGHQNLQKQIGQPVIYQVPNNQVPHHQQPVMHHQQPVLQHQQPVMYHQQHQNPPNV